MKVIIAGSRSMPYRPDLIEQGISASNFNITEVVCGMAAGADSYGLKWATARVIPVTKFPANWERYGKMAGFARNEEMAVYADALILFLYHNSSGSLNMLALMEYLKKPTFVIRNGVVP